MQITIEEHERNLMRRSETLRESLGRALSAVLDGLPDRPGWATDGHHELDRDRILQLRNEHATIMWKDGPSGELPLRRAHADDRWWVADGDAICASHELLVDVLDFMASTLGPYDRFIVEISGGV